MKFPRYKYAIAIENQLSKDHGPLYLVAEQGGCAVRSLLFLRSSSRLYQLNKIAIILSGELGSIVTPQGDKFFGKYVFNVKTTSFVEQAKEALIEEFEKEGVLCSKRSNNLKITKVKIDKTIKSSELSTFIDETEEFFFENKDANVCQKEREFNDLTESIREGFVIKVVLLLKNINKKTSPIASHKITVVDPESDKILIEMRVSRYIDEMVYNIMTASGLSKNQEAELREFIDVIKDAQNEVLSIETDYAPFVEAGLKQAMTRLGEVDILTAIHRKLSEMLN